MKIYAVRWRQKGISDGLEIHSNKKSANMSFKKITTFADETAIYQYEGKDCMQATIIKRWNKKN